MTMFRTLSVGLMAFATTVALILGQSALFNAVIG